MSWLSSALGLDKPANKTVLTAINTVGNVALSTVEAAVPGSTAVISGIEAATGTKVVLVPPTAPLTSSNSTLQTIEVEAGKVATSIDPNADAQIITAMNNALGRWHLGFIEGSVDALFQEELGKLLSAPDSTPTTSTAA